MPQFYIYHQILILKFAQIYWKNPNQVYTDKIDGLLVQWTTTMINSNNTDITNAFRQVDLGDMYTRFKILQPQASNQSCVIKKLL